jgi:hypothetical protein
MISATWCGRQLIEAPYMTVNGNGKGKQKRKHRSKRINKKWLKRYGHYVIQVPNLNIFVTEQFIVGHPNMIKSLKRAMEETNNEQKRAT